MQRLKIALIGCGDISRQHIGAYKDFADRAHVIVCCDTDSARAETAAVALGEGARVTDDYSSVLNDPKVEAVDLCLPHHLHAPMAIAAATAGKQILCEKPLALNAEECNRMIDAACKTGVVLMHLEPMRTAGNIEKAAELIKTGILGKVVGLQGTFGYWQRAELNLDWRAVPAQSGGGHLMDGGIHLVDAMRHLGGEVSAVQAMTAQYRPELGTNSEDIAILNLRYSEGHLGQLFACHATRGRGAAPLLTIFGTEGCLSIDAPGQNGGLLIYRKDQPVESIPSEAAWHNNYHRIIQHFLDVVQHGEPLRATPEDGRENVRLVLAAYESARTGREVKL